MPLRDPECMDRRCVAREIGEDGVIWSCANVSGLWVERMWLLAIMEVSAHAILLGDKPRLGCRGHQFSRAPGRPLLHLFLSLSQTSVGNRCATCCRCPFLLFDRAAGFLPPRPHIVAGRRAQMLSRLAASSAATTLWGASAFTAIEHDGTA
jgi:hypothetical protein